VEPDGKGHLANHAESPALQGGKLSKTKRVKAAEKGNNEKPEEGDAFIKDLRRLGTFLAHRERKGAEIETRRILGKSSAIEC